MYLDKLLRLLRSRQLMLLLVQLGSTSSYILHNFLPHAKGYCELHKIGNYNYYRRKVLLM